MKKIILTLLVSGILGINVNAQKKIYEFPFDGSLSATVGSASFAGAETSYTSDRNGNPNKAISLNNITPISAILDSLPSGKSSRSISIWVNRQGAANTGVFRYGSFANLQIFGMYLDPTGKLVFQGYGNDALTNSILSSNTWVHLVVTYDQFDVKIYVNGALIDTIKRNLNTGDKKFELGNMVGYYDDLKVYDEELSFNQVLSLYLNNEIGTPTIPTKLYDFSFDSLLSASVGVGSFESTNGVYSFVNNRNGQSNKALSIDNVGYLVANLENLPIGKNARTVSLWFNRKGGGNVGILRYGSFANGKMFGVYLNSNNGLVFQGYGSGFDADITQTTTQNSWNHLALCYTGTHLKVFVNGELVTKIERDLNTSLNNLDLGNMQGYYDDLKVYNNSLTDRQAKDLYLNNEIIISQGGGPTSLKEIHNNNQVLVFPNPANDFLNIDVSERTNIQIVNILGVQIENKILEVGINNLDISTFEKGIYFIIQNNARVSRFIKE